MSVASCLESITAVSWTRETQKMRNNFAFLILRCAVLVKRNTELFKMIASINTFGERPVIFDSLYSLPCDVNPCEFQTKQYHLVLVFQLVLIEVNSPPGCYNH